MCPRHGTTVPEARSRRDPAVVEPDIEYLSGDGEVGMRRFFWYRNGILRNYGRTFAGGL